jgi:sugar phosphate isomerase/epimerase
MGDPQLLASYATLAGAIVPLTGRLVSPIPLRRRIEAAGRAGYRGFGFLDVDLAAALSRHSFADIRAMVADNGIGVIELEVLVDWFTTGERRRRSDEALRFMLNAAEMLSARHIKVLGDLQGSDWPVEHMAESFAVLCRRAAEAGTAVCLEIFPASNVRDLATARAIAEATDAPNGGLLLDVWHFCRGGIPFDEILTLRPEHIRHVELNDAAARQIGSIMEDTSLRRMLPGEGELRSWNA